MQQQQTMTQTQTQQMTQQQTQQTMVKEVSFSERGERELDSQAPPDLEPVTQGFVMPTQFPGQDQGYEPSADELIDVLKNLENLAAGNPDLYRSIVDQIKGSTQVSFEQNQHNSSSQYYQESSQHNGNSQQYGQEMYEQQVYQQQQQDAEQY